MAEKLLAGLGHEGEVVAVAHGQIELWRAEFGNRVFQPDDRLRAYDLDRIGVRNRPQLAQCETKAVSNPEILNSAALVQFGKRISRRFQRLCSWAAQSHHLAAPRISFVLGESGQHC